MQRLQNAAMEKRLDNIANMAEDIENSLIQKAARRAKLSQQIEDAQKRKIERAQRSQQERDEADRRRNERAKRSQQEMKMSKNKLEPPANAGPLEHN